MKSRILQLVTERNYVTFKEMSDAIPGFAGSQSLQSAEHPGLVLWPFVSQEAAEVLQELLAAGIIHLHDTSVLNYMLEGQVPHLPVAKSLRAYKSPRWLPVTISKIPVKHAVEVRHKPRR